MGIKRIVDLGFWTHGKHDDFSPEDKYFMLYLLTGPYTTQLGIYEISLKYAAMHLGYSVEAVKVLLDRFENKYGVILYSPGTNEVAVKNYLIHSIIKGGAPVRDCLIKEMKKVKNKELIERVFAHIKGDEKLNATVRGIIAEYEAQNGELHYSNNNDNDNDNENENEVSWDDTSDDTSEPTPPQPPRTKDPEKKHRRGGHGKVLLTDAEVEKLKAEYGIDLTAKAIGFLDEYIAEKGYKSKSHYLAMRRWVIDAVKEREGKKRTTQQGSGNVFLDVLNEMEDF